MHQVAMVPIQDLHLLTSGSHAREKNTTFTSKVSAKNASVEEDMLASAFIKTSGVAY